MWLLSTDRAELHQFISPEDIPNGYAILSHVWGSNEQSYQDTQSLQARAVASGTNPRDLSSAKVRQACILAQKDGYDWLWDDTCCIDKTNSTDVSESINSMYAYYERAEVCYVYLHDVPKKSNQRHSADITLDIARMAAFRASQWHVRGWTLQELLAPPHVLFLDEEWELLGSKADLANVIEEVTNIPVAVLTMEVALESIGIAKRMSWAAGRRTTRPEDQAYCLLGIFSIRMPAIYGEGGHAFLRLQEEIMKHHLDTMLFAWGKCWNYSKEAAAFADGLAEDHLETDESYLLARTPSAFRYCGDIVHIMPVPRKPEGSDRPLVSTTVSAIIKTTLSVST